MARPIKKGLGYFSLDVNFYNDIKIRKIVRRKGGEALSIFTVLLCIIYENGYYLEWSDDVPFLISEATGFEEDKVKEHILYCIEIGLFDKEMFDTHHVITSGSIQKRYSAICALTKRKFDPSSPYLLNNAALDDISSEEIRENSEETVVNSEEIGENGTPNGVNSEKSTQRKEKKSKDIGDSSLHSESMSTAEPLTTKDDDPETPHEVLGDEKPCKVLGGELMDFAAFMAFFNEQVANTSIPRIKQLTPKRKDVLRARCREYGKEALVTVIQKAVASSFLQGGGGRWKATFDWLFGPMNFPKVLEGNYDNQLTQISNNNGTANIRSFVPAPKLTAQQRIDAELARGAEYAKGILARNDASIREGVPEKVW